MKKGWKQGIRRFASVLLTASISVTTVGAFPVQTFAAGDEAIYVSEVMAYQGSLEDAKTNYPDYIFGEEDISQDGGSGTSTYLGYKTTDDISLAIRDIAALQMNGNYKISDYQTLVQEKKEGIKSLVYELQVAAREYKENYAEGKQRALDAYGLLNKYYEEDTGLKMGDFFLADESRVTYDNYETLIMQSNSTSLTALKEILLTAVDTEADVWVDRLAKMQNFEGLLEKINAERKEKGEAAMSYKAGKAYYTDLYQDTITYFKEGWELLRTGLNKYLEAGISVSDEESAAYMEELVEAKEGVLAEEYATYGAIYEILEQIPYEDGSMVDFFLQPFDEVDESQLYVLMDAMSEAQRELGTDLGFAQLFLAATRQSMETENEDCILTLPEETRNFVEEEMEELQGDMTSDLEAMIDVIEELEGNEVVEAETIENHAVSVYAGVDREYFNGSLGMTSDSQKQQLSSDTPWYDSTGIVISSYVAGVIGVTLTAVGIYQLVASARALASETAEMAEISETLTVLRGNLSFYDEGIKSATENWQVINQQISIVKNTSNLSKLQKIENLNELNNALKFYEDELEVLKTERTAKLAKIEKLENSETMLQNSSASSKILGTSLLVIGIALTAYSLTVNIMRLLNEEDPAYGEIPEKMVDTSKADDSIQPYLYYNVVRNQNGRAADLNHYTSGTWLALYTTRSYDAGLPILAKDFGSIRRGDLGSDSLNKGFAHEFGARDPQNLLGYSINAKDAEAVYLLYDQGDADLSASVFGGNALTAVLILAGLAIAGGGVFFLFRRKKRRMPSL